MFEFVSAENPPEVGRGDMGCFILLIKRGERHTALPAWYLNRHPLDYEDCICGEDHEDGCPTTGWFHDSSNFDYEHCYQSVEGEIVAWSPIPTVDEALANMRGPW